MILEISPLREENGARLDFDFPLNLAELDLYGECPIPAPVRVTGFTENRADMFLLHIDIDFTLVTRCARCLKPLEIPIHYAVDRPMADSVANEDDENEEIIILDGGAVSLADVATETIVLEAEKSHLCHEECPGLCPKCGADLNEGDCGCPQDVDERFAALADIKFE
jgi:uncharacterized protein